MKKSFILAVLMVIGLAFCVEASASTCNGIGNCNVTVNNETNVTEVTEVKEESSDDPAYGPGADLVLFEDEAEKVAFVSEYRYDANNDDHSVFGVFKLNLWKIFAKK